MFEVVCVLFVRCIYALRSMPSFVAWHRQSIINRSAWFLFPAILSQIRVLGSFYSGAWNNHQGTKLMPLNWSEYCIPYRCSNRKKNTKPTYLILSYDVFKFDPLGCSTFVRIALKINQIALRIIDTILFFGSVSTNAAPISRTTLSFPNDHAK